MSKSGLYAHFGSKEQLQLETVAAAQSIFEEEVVRPSLEAPAGLARQLASAGKVKSKILLDLSDRHGVLPGRHPRPSRGRLGSDRPPVERHPSPRRKAAG